jgi:hypothetical protein
MPRQIIYELTFDSAVDELGGYARLDVAIDPVVDALGLNPYAFPRFENDFISFRYAITKPIEELPSFVIYFTINPKGDVSLEHIEENSPY